MEMIVFCITIGIILCFAVFGIGLAIGRECSKHEGNDKEHSRCTTKCKYNNSGICDSRSNNLGDSNVGDVLRKEPYRRPLGMVQELENEELANLLQVMKMILGVSPGEKDVLDEAAYRLTEGLKDE